MLKSNAPILKVISIVFITLFLLCIVLYLMAEGMCSTQYLSEKVYSPDGKYFVQIEDESCGGATGENTTGIIINNSKSFFSNFNNAAAQVINAQTGNRKGVFGARGGGESIITSWVDKRTLKITLPSCGNIEELEKQQINESGKSWILGRDNSWKDIKIIYEGTCPEN